MPTQLKDVKLTFTYQDCNSVRCLLQSVEDNLNLVTIGVNSDDARLILQACQKVKTAKDYMLLKMLEAKR